LVELRSLENVLFWFSPSGAGDSLDSLLGLNSSGILVKSHGTGLSPNDADEILIGIQEVVGSLAWWASSSANDTWAELSMSGFAEDTSFALGFGPILNVGLDFFATVVVFLVLVVAFGVVLVGSLVVLAISKLVTSIATTEVVVKVGLAGKTNVIKFVTVLIGASLFVVAVLVMEVAVNVEFAKSVGMTNGGGMMAVCVGGLSSIGTSATNGIPTTTCSNKESIILKRFKENQKW
jgi:hypothetical protein